MCCVCFLFAGYALSQGSNKEHNLTPVDYVNPYMGNISHLLVPTYPTIHLPNSMLRVYPERSDYTGSQLHGLPLIITSHRGTSAFNLSPCQGEPLQPVVNYSYDHENVKPYYYEVFWMKNKLRSSMRLHVNRLYTNSALPKRTNRLISL